MPSRGSGEAHAVPRTTLSPWRTIAEPCACFAKCPVSIWRVLPPASSTVAVCFMSSSFPGGQKFLLQERAIKYETTEDTLLPPTRNLGENVFFDFNRLFTDSKFLDDVFITLGIVLFKIVQQAAALADHHKKTAPGGMVFFVVLEVLRQLSDTFTQNSNLYFRAAGI